MFSSRMFDVSFMLAVVFAITCAASGFMFMNINMAKEEMSGEKSRDEEPGADAEQ